MAKAGQLPSDEVRSGTGLHDDGTGMKNGEKYDQLWAAELFAQQCFTLAILSVDMKAVFAKIDADEHDVFHDGLLQK